MEDSTVLLPSNATALFFLALGNPESMHNGDQAARCSGFRLGVFGRYFENPTPVVVFVSKGRTPFSPTEDQNGTKRPKAPRDPSSWHP